MTMDRELPLEQGSQSKDDSHEQFTCVVGKSLAAMLDLELENTVNG